VPDGLLPSGLLPGGSVPGEPATVVNPPTQFRLRPNRPRTWVLLVVLAWIVILVAGAGWALTRGGPTAREQTTVAQAQPVVDEAARLIFAAATSDGHAAAAVSGFDRVGGCSVTVFRDGERYQRTVTAVVTPGTEIALLHRVADRLPERYHATVSSGVVPKLSGDAGFWVGLSGSQVGKGQVRFVADTGSCRTTGDLTVTDHVVEVPGVSDNRGQVQAVLARLGLSAPPSRTSLLDCPGGGYLSTVEAVADGGVEPGAFDDLLRGLGSEIVATPDAYAYATGPTEVAARYDANHIVVTATTACP
jgi:hypothetical protein